MYFFLVLSIYSNSDICFLIKFLLIKYKSNSVYWQFQYLLVLQPRNSYWAVYLRLLEVLVALYYMEKMKNVRKIIKYSLLLLTILTFVNTYLCTKIQLVGVELESDIVNISNISNLDLDLEVVEEKEERQNFSGIFQQRVKHVNNICKYFSQDLTGLG